MKPHSALKALLLILAIGGFQTAMAKSEISAEKQTAIDQVNTLESEIANMSMELWNFSEIALREHKSAEFLATILETEGFTVERGVAHMPTAFVAEWGKDSPVVGILADCASSATAAAMSIWWRLAAIEKASAPVAARVAWWSQPPTWSITSSRKHPFGSLC